METASKGLNPENGDCLRLLTFCESFFFMLWGVPPCRRHPRIPSFAQTGTPNFNPAFTHLFMAVTFEQMTIKHSMYMQKVPFQYTEMACVVFFQNLP